MEEQEQLDQVEELKNEQNKKEAFLVETLKKYGGAPTQDQIETWKAKYGDVYVSGVSETELFIWRAISRTEWIELQRSIAEMGDQADQYKFEEMLCNICILWKSVKGDWRSGKAGTPTTLQEQILQNSNFTTPQTASMLVAKL